LINFFHFAGFTLVGLGIRIIGPCFVCGQQGWLAYARDSIASFR